ncbi:antigen identified by monoclonal antibody Ki-67 [Coemansia sp. RSA 1285]|nr:antigen identified by monoclonal antibody Ki-67 [Coemansia sp. RSA 1285]
MTIQPKYGHLVIISRSGADGKAFPMHHARVMIGRKETCDIRMQRPQVSKEHCIIRAVNNELVLTNLSENGTTINSKTLAGVHQRQVLHTGDVITIVGRSLRYEALSKDAAVEQPVGEISRQVNALATVRKLGRRQLSHPLGNSERISRKLRIWDEHYSDLRAESPPPGLFDDDPFGGTDVAPMSLFNRMVARVERGMSMDVVSSVASPLKRTLSNGGQVGRKDLMDILDGTSPFSSTNNSISNGNGNGNIVGPVARIDKSPSPDAVHGMDEAPVCSETEQNPTPMLASNNAANVSALPLPAATLSLLRSKAVRFGPPLSPEVFDTQAPPSTPLRRGTPLPIKRISSILRPNQQLSSSLAMDGISEAPLADSPTSNQKSLFDIESPVSNRKRRRRSLRTARNERRVTMEPLSFKPSCVSASSSSSSPQLLVRTKPQPDPFLDVARKRKERRKTAPVVPDATASVPSIAELAAALGEDIPTHNPPAKVQIEQPADPAVAESDVARDEDEFGALPLPASALEPLSSQKPLGLAEAFHMTVERTNNSNSNNSSIKRQDSKGKDTDEEEDDEDATRPKRTASSLEMLLEEQANLQARFSGGVRLDISERLGRLSVDSTSRRRRRQTVAVVDDEGLNEPLGEPTGTADDTDSLIAHRQRLRRMQERKRRRQTVAELKRRRSSWRGWTGGSPLTGSPPLSAGGHVEHATSSDIDEGVGARKQQQTASSLLSSATSYTSIAMPTKQNKRTVTTVYPPKPIPIDEGWEIVNPQQPDRTPSHAERREVLASANETAITKGPAQRKQTPLQEPPVSKQQPSAAGSSSSSLRQPSVLQPKPAVESTPETPKQTPRPRQPVSARTAGRRRRQTIASSENKETAALAKADASAATPKKKRQLEPPLATPPVTRSAKRTKRTISR